MKTLSRFTGVALLIATAAFLPALSGCGKNDKKAEAPAKDVKGEEKGAVAVGSKHDDWWCYEHGVPEATCALCNKDLVAKFKKDGDWCKEHGRPESQCFICDPSRYDQFEAIYVAKYGEKPIRPGADQFESKK